MIHGTTTDNGGYHAIVQTNWEGVTAVGVVTGAQYQLINVVPQVLNGRLIEEKYTTTTIFRLIGPGPTDNVVGQTLYHFTVNPNGEVTVIPIGDDIIILSDCLG